MVRKVFFIFLVAVAVCCAGLGLMVVARPKPIATALADLPAPPAAAVRFGGDVLVAAGPAGLYQVSPESGTARPVYKITGQQVTDVFVVDGIVYSLAAVTADRSRQLHEIDLAAGGVARNIALTGSVSDVAAFLPGDRLLVIEGGQVRFIDLKSGRTVDRVPVPGGVLGAGDLVGDTLYVARSYAGGIAVIDTKTAKLVDVIDVPAWLTRVGVCGRRAYVAVAPKGLGMVDLDSRAFETLSALDFCVSDDGQAYVIDTVRLERIDADGQVIERVGLPAELVAAMDGQAVSLLAVGDNEALLGVGSTLYRLTWPHASAAPAPAES